MKDGAGTPGDIKADSNADIWFDACLAAAVFAVDPARLGGIAVRASAGDLRDRWTDAVRDCLGNQKMRRVPIGIPEARLLGGLDLAATLSTGRAVAEIGLLAEADGEVLVLVSAERLASSTVAHVTAALDTGEIALERDGLAERRLARFGVIAFDEGLDDDERPASALLDRLALTVDLTALSWRDASPSDWTNADIDAARDRLPRITVQAGVIDALCQTAAALGVASLRASIFALQAAKIIAALAGHESVEDEDATAAARLVLAPRATVLPARDPQDAPEPPHPETKNDTDTPDKNDAEPDRDQTLDDVVLAAAIAAIPAGLLTELKASGAARGSAKASGRAGQIQKAARRGRPVGVVKAKQRGAARLNVVETLRAAAPWQTLRRRQSGGSKRIQVRKDDFRISRFKHRIETTTIFVVDASGSAALHRLAEAKGAVELLLADCYVRRDQVALVAFRGRGAEILLPPTRSLVRAKRRLAGLPGGGATPLASGIDTGLALAGAVRRKGQAPTIVVLTDGRANIARDASPGRERAMADALLAARGAKALRLTSVLIDVSQSPHPDAKAVADAMGAHYLALPHADATTLSQAVKSVTASD